MVEWLTVLLPLGALWCLLSPALRPQSHQAEELTVFAAGLLCGLGAATLGFALAVGGGPVQFVLTGALLLLSPLGLVRIRWLRTRRLFENFDDEP
jgi:hypothetical protein